MSKRFAVCTTLVIVAALLSASAWGAEAFMYPGAICSFADNPLSKHNRVDHAFKNLSGSNQWVTCPIEHKAGKGIQGLTLDVGGTSSNPRFESRAKDTGAVAGWAISSSISRSNSNVYKWFDGEVFGAPEFSDGLAFEINLSNNAFVSRAEAWWFNP